MKRFLVILTIIFSVKLVAQDYKSFAMWNTALPVEQRVNDVVSRLTLAECNTCCSKIGHTCI
jgi:hypothetical protein